MIETTDLVLVAVLKEPRDLEIARVLGWYRIPLKSAPKLLQVDAIAFYQTSRFGKERWSIRYAARVRGIELTTRMELLQEEPDHPRAREEYFKLQLGSLEALPRSIPSRAWRRITFFYSTGERLLGAQEVNDLILQSSERELLWNTLSQNGLFPERQYSISDSRIVDMAFLCKAGNLGVLFDAMGDPPLPQGWETLNLDSAQVREDVTSTSELIFRSVARLGGAKF